MAELLDLYDKDGNLTNKKVLRGQPFEEGYYVAIVHLCLFNSKGEMLCQQRAFHKTGYPGYWDISASGFIKTNENILEGMQRELKEELGIEYVFNENDLYFLLRSDATLDYFFFLLKDYDKNTLTPQKEEVNDINYYSLDKIEDMMNNDTFIPYDCYNMIKKVANVLKSTIKV